MAKRVAVLLVGNLPEALRDRRVRTAHSEPYWLESEQYIECGDGGVQFFPSKASELMIYAREHDLCPLGIVIVNEQGDYSDFLNDDAIAPDDREFARRLFQTHAHFWFCYLPSLADQQTDS